MTENSAKRTGVVLAGDHRRHRTCGRRFRRCSGLLILLFGPSALLYNQLLRYGPTWVFKFNTA